MNTSHDEHDDALRLQLRALRRDIEPQADLWPGIAARIDTASRQQANTPSRRHVAPWAMAAVLALAVGLGWQLRPDGQVPQTRGEQSMPPSLAELGVSMSREYEAALRELDLAYGPVDDGGVLAELDASAAIVTAALEQAPDAPFLLQRLHSIHAHRLALIQRLARA